MGPVAGFGIADATLEIVGEFNGVTLAARGSPMVLAGEQSNLILKFRQGSNREHCPGGFSKIFVCWYHGVCAQGGD